MELYLGFVRMQGKFAVRNVISYYETLPGLTGLGSISQKSIA
ncbi:hypothetical protein CBM2626_A40258 [Cupriavidus taiwanensis]|nr:hypothetical protein CBM2626_A40258 [Cupriavidus taiwanensis]